MEKSGRLIRILLLIQARKSVTAQELARLLEISQRQIYRDIEALSLWGVPIIADSGRGGGYKLPENYTIDASIFTGNEIKLLSTGSVAIQGFSDLIEDYKDVNIASSKLISVLSEEERLIVGRHLNYIYFDRSRWYKAYAKTDKLQSLKNAVIYNTQVVIESHEFFETKDETRETLVDPYGLVYKSDTWYLVGYSSKENKIRRWNSTRIKKVVVTNQEFYRPLDFSLKDWWTQELEDFGKGNTRVLMRVSKSAWHRFERFQWKKDNQFFDGGSYYLVEMKVDHYEWLIDVIMVNRGEAEILEPIELREKIARTASSILQRHTSEVSDSAEEKHIVDFEIFSATDHELD